MIETLDFSVLSNELLFTLSQRSLKYYNDSDLSHASLQPYVQNTEDHFHQFRIAYEKETSSPHLVLMARKDDARDEAFIAFRNYVEACTHRHSDNWKQAAITILQVINRYGWNAWNSSCREETIIFNQFINELKEKHTWAISAINAADWLTELITAQQEYEAICQKYPANHNQDTPTIKASRLPLVESIRALFEITGLLNQAVHSDGLQKLITSLNEIVSETKATSLKLTNQESKVQEHN